MKSFIKFLVPALVILAALLACGESSNTGTLANGNTPGSNTSNTPTSAPIAKHFKVGDTVIVGNNAFKVVVNSITTNQGSQYESPKGVFVVIDVTLTNTSSKEYDLSSYNFTLKNTDGTRYDAQYVTLDGVSEMPTGKIVPGDVAKGDLVYDVPVSAKSFTFSFAPDTFGSGQTTWDLSL